MVGALVLVAVVNPYFLIMVGIIGTLFLFMRHVFLKSSKNIKRLEGISEYYRELHQYRRLKFGKFIKLLVKV